MNILNITEQDILFAHMDSQISPQWPGLIQKNIEKEGYTYISEYIFYEYFTEEKTLSEVGNTIGVRGSTVLRWMQVFGFKRRQWGGIRKFKDPQNLTRIIEARKAGFGIKKLARMFDCSHKTITKVLRGEYYV